jgi:Tfp pilus assembly protein PilF
MLANYSFLTIILLFSQHCLSAECIHIAQLISLEGKVEKRSDGDTQWQQAALNDKICTGDALRTLLNSRAAVRLTNDTLVRLDHSSALTFTQIGKSMPSLLDLLRGALHFISRTTEHVHINTPYVNASIDGTEFIVRIENETTEVTVLEGVVVASNRIGSIKLDANQAARGTAYEKPVRFALANPFDAVSWALYYPPLPEEPSKADTLAQTAIKAIVQNQIDKAVDLAKRALAEDSQSSAAYMAQSYVSQAMFDIPTALENSKKAAELAPQSALTQARLAENWLMIGDSSAARKIAANAVSLDAGSSLAHTVLGFASLRDIDLTAAKKAFEEAIRLDSASPLPRLGLGLLQIRKGKLEEGRKEIETAVLLNPSNALLRAYLGKAYSEEKRNALAYDQLGMAKFLDKNDPTAWFYDSILLQSDNDPVGALLSQKQAIKLNDNRGVYRSRQLLDKDEAARNVALGRIYNDLNFEQQARDQATDSLALNPANHSAHRLLADSYSGLTNLDAARQSELLQSKLIQPLNLDPLQPQLSNSNLGLLDGNGPGELSYSEYNPLFTRNGLAFQLDTSIAEEETWSNDAILAGLYSRFAFSFGQYHTETEGLRENADYEQDLYNIFAQYAISDKTSFQLEVNQDEVVKGDVAQRLIPSLLIDENLRYNTEFTTYRVGAKHAISANTLFLFNTKQTDIDDVLETSTSSGTGLNKKRDIKLNIHDIQILHSSNTYQFLAGINYNQDELFSATTFDFSPRPCLLPYPDCTYQVNFTEKQYRLYGYYFFQPIKTLHMTTALSVVRNKSEIFSDTETHYLPKLGAQWSLSDNSKLHAALFKTDSSAVSASFYQTLEPTHIAGFNQIHDEFRQTDSWNYGLGYIHDLAPTLSSGIRGLYREGETPFEVEDTATFISSTLDVEFDETNTAAWINWSARKYFSLSLEYGYSKLDTATNVSISQYSGISPDGVVELETHRTPITANYYHPSGIIIGLTATYFNQKGVFKSSAITDPPQEAKDSFWLTDLLLSYRLPEKLGLISLGVKNVFNEEFNFEDRNSYDSMSVESSASPSSLSPERLVFGQLSITFR